MMLVYSSKITNRLRYTLDLLLGSILGVAFELTSDAETFLNFKGAVLNYSDKKLKDGELHIVPSGFLEMRGVKPLVPEFEIIDGLASLFPSRKGGNPLGFDPFSASFYLVSRYEEYLPFKKDIHGRFEARQSYAYKNNFLDQPVVNHYAIRIRQALLERFPFMDFHPLAYSFLPTYDIDVAYAYKGRGGLRTIYGFLSSLFRGDTHGVVQRWQVLFNKQQDPFDTYDLQLSLHKKFGLKAHYFFQCGDYGPYDKNISFFSKKFQSLVKKISDYAYTGVHPSYIAHDDSMRLAEEIRRMEMITKREIRFSRQHYLRLSLPQTYRNLLKNDISHDFTMGYATLPGFRAGICSPFYFYDLEKESPTNLMVCPFAIMDTTLKDYMALKPEQAIKTIGQYVDTVANLGGAFISLWHNESLCDCGRWHGWRRVYQYMIRKGASHLKPK